MNPRDFLWRRGLVWWCFAMVAWYVVSLARWASPGIIKWSLPFFGASSPPDPAVIGGGLAVLAASVAATIVACLGAGRPAARLFRMADAGAGRAIPLGLAVLGTALLGLGLAGLWYRPLLLAVLVPPATGGAVLLVSRGLRLPGGLSGLGSRRELVFPAVLVGWVMLLGCLAPETFQDALRYHLFVPKRFLLEHKFIFMERFFFWSYMGPVQMLYGAALAFGGETAAKGVNLSCGLLALAALGRVLLRAGFDAPTRALALGLAVSAPGLGLITCSAFVEHALGLYSLVALESLVAGGTPRKGALRESLLFLGIAASVKYTALFAAAGVAALVLFPARGEAVPAVRRRTLAVLTAVLLAGWLPWGTVKWAFTGDPVSPILARAGVPTMDSSSGPALEKAYEFAAKAHTRWLSDPGRLFSWPADFSGAHSGFWEHPGPAIPALVPAAVFAFTGLASPLRRLLLFSAGSAGAWLLLFGGVSPHYISGFAGVWAAALVGVLGALPGHARILMTGTLRFTVFFQALISVVAMTYGFGPRDVALGTMGRDEYLMKGLYPAPAHYLARRELEARAPGRGTVWAYGDDQSYYLSGRVRCDYEMGSDPFLWRLASSCRNPAELRKRLGQRGITHLLYSSRFPDMLSQDGELAFRYDGQTLALVQDFWRSYAIPLVYREARGLPFPAVTCAFTLSRVPRREDYDPYLGTRLPFLPGTESMSWRGDEALVLGDPAKAREEYAKGLAEWPGSVILHERMARVMLAAGDRAGADRHLSQMKKAGWKPSRLRASRNIRKR